MDKKDNDGITALQLSVMTGNLSMIKFLLSYKADIMTVDKVGFFKIMNN